jgi:hypothetical protein
MQARETFRSARTSPDDRRQARSGVRHREISELRPCGCHRLAERLATDMQRATAAATRRLLGCPGPKFAGTGQPANASMGSVSGPPATGRRTAGIGHKRTRPPLLSYRSRPSWPQLRIGDGSKRYFPYDPKSNLMKVVVERCGSVFGKARGNSVKKDEAPCCISELLLHNLR